MPRASVLTIVPFTVEPRYVEIARGWIYEPNLWDLTDSDRAVVKGPLSSPSSPIYPNLRQILDTRGPRKVISMIGILHPGKGLDYFVALWTQRPDIRSQYLFVAAGPVSPSAAHYFPSFADAGGLLFNEVLSEDDILRIYGVSDAIWACYAPSFDQGSGIFGRAAQLAIPTIVRAGARIHTVAQAHGFRVIPLEYGNLSAEIPFLHEPSSAPSSTNPQVLLNQSLTVMRSFL